MNMLDVINKELKKRDMSVSELERKADLGNGTIRRWDKSYPSLDKAIRVSEVLEVPIIYLYDGTESPCEQTQMLARKIEKLDETKKNMIKAVINMEEGK